MINEFDPTWDLELLGRQLSIVAGSIVLQDTDAKFLTANASSMGFMGFKTYDELHAKLPGDMRAKLAELHDEMVANIKLIVKHKTKITSIYSAYDVNNNWGLHLTQQKPLLNDKGEIVGVIAESFDVTKLPLATTLTPIFLDIQKKNNIHLSQGVYIYADIYKEWQFSKRQAECLFWLMHRKTAVEIGAILGLTKRTVEAYIRNIKEKFQVHTAAQLVEVAKEKGLDTYIPEHWIRPNGTK